MGPSNEKLKRHKAIRRKELCEVIFKCFIWLTVANWKLAAAEINSGK